MQHWEQKHDWPASRWLAVRCSTGSVALPIVGDSWVASARVSIATQLDSTSSWVELRRYRRAFSVSAPSSGSAAEYIRRLKTKMGVVNQDITTAIRSCRVRCAYSNKSFAELMASRCLSHRWQVDRAFSRRVWSPRLNVWGRSECGNRISGANLIS